MSEMIKRSLRLGSATTTVRMSEDDWAHIDRAAKAQGFRAWSTWAKTVLRVEGDKHVNRTELLRQAAFTALASQINETAFDSAGEEEMLTPHPLRDGTQLFQHDEFLEAVAEDIVELLPDIFEFGGFNIRFGWVDGQPSAFIENRIRGALSTIITLQGENSRA